MAFEDENMKFTRTYRKGLRKNKITNTTKGLKEMAYQGSQEKNKSKLKSGF